MTRHKERAPRLMPHFNRTVCITALPMAEQPTKPCCFRHEIIVTHGRVKTVQCYITVYELSWAQLQETVIRLNIQQPVDATGESAFQIFQLILLQIPAGLGFEAHPKVTGANCAARQPPWWAPSMREKTPALSPRCAAPCISGARINGQRAFKVSCRWLI
ncbi:hypothetical protein BO86DRAFT_187197 [Aspergillus japonicus CBS 114.51]|uniref:Uncharacterized protein n=1 Tax=Aspergillus japonicus CBS 114.51 TaxID=1448312 RepID=A0A8T8XBN8_ASPJA|nr:hypothetical protein BO86DRAFT_187197 [Aspergillus japonicus CBS 114.51]RAH85264.1 hypothetical protein BO86DRAFT_187197 [Aspergillus japonicus CBS 114.51]